MEYKNNQLLGHLFTVAAKSPSRVAILMSGVGTNARNILEHRSEYPTLEFVGIFTDNPKSNAQFISEDFDVPYELLNWNDFKNREEYFKELLNILQKKSVDFLVYAGFMKITPKFFVEAIPGVNVHPADLSLRDDQKGALYTGMDPIGDAKKAGEDYVASTAHLVDEEVDQGVPLMISRELPIKDSSKSTAEIHEELKKHEHELYPLFLKKLSLGALTIEELPIKIN